MGKSNTHLWYVGVAYENDHLVILVSLNPSDRFVCKANSFSDVYSAIGYMRIRAITGRAAGRKFLKYNLSEHLQNLFDDEPWNHVYDRPTEKHKQVAKGPWDFRHYMKACKEFVQIVVDKTPNPKKD